MMKLGKLFINLAVFFGFLAMPINAAHSIGFVEGVVTIFEVVHEGVTLYRGPSLIAAQMATHTAASSATALRGECGVRWWHLPPARLVPGRCGSLIRHLPPRAISNQAANTAPRGSI